MADARDLRISDDEAEATADVLVGPPVDSLVSRAYVRGQELTAALDAAVVALTQARMATILRRPHDEIRELADEAARHLHVVRTGLPALLDDADPPEGPRSYDR